MRTLFNCPSSSRRGAILVAAVITFFLLVAFVGLALDTAFVRSTAQQLQAAADAAALAGTEQLDLGNDGNQYGPVRQAALDTAVANEADALGVQILPNYGNAADGDVVVGVWDPEARTFTPGTAGPNAVQVRARRTADAPGGPVDLLFGSVFGSNQSEVSRSAIATRDNASGPAVVLVLDPAMPKAFDMRGTTTMLAMAGTIQVNSTNQVQALYLNGAPDVARARAKAIKVTGVSQFPKGAISPVPQDGSPPVPDPLAGLPYPDPGTMTDYGAITGPGNYLPGYYPGGIDSSGGDIYLDPGVYVLGAPTGVNLNGDALVHADGGVMLFLEQGAAFEIAGIGAGVEITAPASGTYEGVAIFGHRASTASFDISGSGTFRVRGAMYMAGGHLEMDGNVDRQIGRIIVNSLQFRGTGVYNITGEGPPEYIPLYSFLVR